MARARSLSRSRAATWGGVYLLVAAAPLVLAGFEVGHGRGVPLMVNLSTALGFVALSVLGLQFALATRGPLAGALGIDVLLRHHRQLTLLAVTAALAHPALMVAFSTGGRGLLDLRHAPVRELLGWGSVTLLAVLVATTLWRRALHLSYPAWHLLHSVSGIALVLLALGHVLLVDGYTAWMPLRALCLAYGAVFVWLALWVRLLRPMRLWHRPWRVASLWPEPGRSLTVGLEPVHQHSTPRLRFQAGQFAWILTGRSPFRPTYHPFSMSSSALRERVEFTICESGDFTRSAKQLKIGDRVYLDGPHGTFTLEQHRGPGYVFIAAGAGITPFLSMLATMADLRDARPCWLFLGNRQESQITGIRQLSRIAGRLDLTTVHVVSRPGPAWLGERGRLTPRVIAKHLPDNYRDLHYFVCASPDVVRSIVRMLRRGLEVPAAQVHVEKFQLA